MRLIVIAKERAPIIATTIHAICSHVGQAALPPFAWTVRAARSAAVSANGSAKMECSNLIISSTVRMRLVFICGIESSIPKPLRFARAGFRAAFPAILLLLRKAELPQRAANKLLHQFVN